MSSKDGGAAFPISRENEGWYESGMTLRDYFAGQALQAVIGACAVDDRHANESFEEMFARKAYLVADAMLEARKS